MTNTQFINALMAQLRHLSKGGTPGQYPGDIFNVPHTPASHNPAFSALLFYMRKNPQEYLHWRSQGTPNVRVMAQRIAKNYPQFEFDTHQPSVWF